MYFQITLINAFLLVSLTNAYDAEPSTPTYNIALTTAATFPASENMAIQAGTDFYIPDYMLDEEIELTPEESQLHRVNLGKIFARLSKSSPDTLGEFGSSKIHKTGNLGTLMNHETGGQSTSTSVTSDSAIVPDSDKVEDKDVDHSAADEGNMDLDTSPEETELRRGGRGGRGGRGRGRGGRGHGRFGRGRGRFGRGRFGRGGRFGRFGGRRFGRFGRFGGWGSRWYDDCGGDDCGDC
ncbi:hypothetical protein K7432_016570 [Basidiobolus ranarum]|uniref:Uncharacterized protein n=1 Tax=Basidiobolus ranarum TaxID=34480 RepID=A0ABR2WEJ3_9FUNG